MSTTTPIQDITKALHTPGSITDADVEQASLILESYPYFVPARYIDAANMHKVHTFAPATMAAMQLYKGNWLQYYQFLQAANNNASFEAKNTTPVSIQNEIQEIDFEDALKIVPTPSPVYIPSEEAAVQEVHEPENDINYSAESSDLVEEPATEETDDSLISPIYTEDYFLHQGIQVSNDMPDDTDQLNDETTGAVTDEEEDKSLMVVMSFTQWLHHFKTKTQREKEEKEDQRALKTMWQKERLAGALEEENEEIPENVFEMAVNSITKEEGLISEPLVEIYVKQGKYDKAIVMLRILSLRNPQKNVYFARRIEEILKEKDS
jgi:hypothetical protein